MTFFALQLALRGVKGQRAQQVCHLAIGPHHHVLHRRAVCHHTEVFRKVRLWREVGRALEVLIRQCRREHTVERVDRHALAIVGQHVPPLVEELHGVGVYGLRIGFRSELPIAHLDGARLSDGLQDHRQELVSRWHILQYDTFFDGRAVAECQARGEGREEPLLRAVALDLRGVADIIMIGLVALDHESEHVEDRIAVFVEAASWQGIAVGHLVCHPQVVQFAERQLPALSQRVHDPHVVLELLSVCHNNLQR